MSATPNNRDHLEAALTHLLASHDEAVPASWVRPDAAVIDAYVSRTATALQKKRVREAMHANSEFQAEILARCQAQDDATDVGLAREMRAVRVPLKELMRRAKADKPRDSRWPGIYRYSKWLREPAVKLSLAAAATLTLVIIWTNVGREVRQDGASGFVLVQLEPHLVFRDADIRPSELVVPKEAREVGLVPPAGSGRRPDNWWPRAVAVAAGRTPDLQARSAGYQRVRRPSRRYCIPCTRKTTCFRQTISGRIPADR